jgi:hypothetical protein
MGAGNVVLVVSNWFLVPDPAFRVLVQMALISLDRDTPPRYFGGRTPLLRVMGRDSDHPSPSDYQALKRAIATLVDNGVVSVDKPATKTRAAVYSLHLSGTSGVPDRGP